MNKQTQKLMFSSLRQDWATPQYIFDELDKEFHFTLDPCCSEKTAKCKKFYTIKEDGLKQDWRGESVFVNPPFGREQAAWIKKGYEESLKENTIVVFLIPARTDTRAFHKYIYPNAEIRFIQGRIKFENPESKTPKSQWTAAPFPSMICILQAGKQSAETQLQDKIERLEIDCGQALNDRDEWAEKYYELENQLSQETKRITEIIEETKAFDITDDLTIAKHRKAIDFKKELLSKINNHSQQNRTSTSNLAVSESLNKTADTESEENSMEKSIDVASSGSSNSKDSQTEENVDRLSSVANSEEGMVQPLSKSDRATNKKYSDSK